MNGDSGMETYTWPHVKHRPVGIFCMNWGALLQPRRVGWGVGGRFWREGIWLVYVDAWQKPTQYWKAIILQLKINTLKKFSSQNLFSNRCVFKFYLKSGSFISLNCSLCTLQFENIPILQSGLRYHDFKLKLDFLIRPNWNANIQLLRAFRYFIILIIFWGNKSVILETF